MRTQNQAFIFLLLIIAAIFFSGFITGRMSKETQETIDLNVEIVLPSATPTATPTPTPVKKTENPATRAEISSFSATSDTNYSKEDIEAYIRSKSWDADLAVAIAKAESGLNAQSRSYDGCCFGVFQIHSVHKLKFAGASFFDPYKNIDVAFQIYSASGWQPWGAFTNGSYKKYL